MRLWENRWYSGAALVDIAASFLPWSRQHVTGFVIASFAFIVIVGMIEIVVRMKRRRSTAENIEPPRHNGEVSPWGTSMAPARSDKPRI